MQKLLEGDRPVLSLLRTNPFPDRPPRYVRAQLYEYHFTTPVERAATAQWWTRKLVGTYFPAISKATAADQGVSRGLGGPPWGPPQQEEEHSQP